jgi:predicted amidophosphoribosyltransferase
VPAFLLAGPIAAFMRWRQESSVLGGQGTCPACSADMTLEAGADEWPLFRICETCRASVRIEKREVVETLAGFPVPDLRGFVGPIKA